MSGAMAQHPIPQHIQTGDETFLRRVWKGNS
uniref:Uncharacterized protein n=1 Tax=Trichinella nativa TaxID=6335 RepID=A0A0V1IKK4_9BILA